MPQIRLHHSFCASQQILCLRFHDKDLFHIAVFRCHKYLALSIPGQMIAEFSHELLRGKAVLCPGLRMIQNFPIDGVDLRKIIGAHAKIRGIAEVQTSLLPVMAHLICDHYFFIDEMLRRLIGRHIPGLRSQLVPGKFAQFFLRVDLPKFVKKPGGALRPHQLY